MNLPFSGWKTILAGLVMIGYAVLAESGADIPTPDDESSLMVGGIVAILFRLITTGPVAFKRE